MIGIGVITYNRTEHLRLCLEKIQEFTSDYILYIHDDSVTKKGIAYGKNKCLEHLKGCDHIFLFDDDVFPKKVGWTDYFINSGYKHSCYMNNDYQPAYHGDKHTSYIMCSGVFIYLTKEVFETVGYFNPEYGRYGYEHAGYSHRIHQAGLTPSRFICLNETKDYIYSLDLDGIEGYEFLNHKRSITDLERAESVKKNNLIYMKETTEHQVYYNFKP